jgi:hypothetical protein
MRLLPVFAFAVVAAVANHATAQNQQLEFSGGGRLLGYTATTLTYVNAQGHKQEVKFPKAGEMSVTLKPAKGAPQAIVAGPPNVDVTGELAPEQIRAGFTVVINCKLDAKGATAKPVEAVKVLDVKPDSPGIHPEGQMEGDTQAVLIKGIAKGYKNGVLTVSVPKGDLAPKGTIALELAESVKVTFESDNPATAMPGSTVEVKGFQYGVNGEVAASEIKITLPPPAVKKPKKRSVKPAPGAKPGEEEAAPKDDATPPKDGDAPSEPAPGGRKKPTTPGKVQPISWQSS